MRKRQPFLERMGRACIAASREISRGGKRAVDLALVNSGGPYKGAEINRLTYDFLASLSAPDDETKLSARVLRARSRDLDRNNPYVRQFLSLVTTNVIGVNGATLAPQNRDSRGDLDKRINSAIEDSWSGYSEAAVTLDESLDMASAQRLFLRTVAVDGELFLRKRFDAVNPWRFALEPIDSDLVDENLNQRQTERANEIRMGIEIDSVGRRVAYHILRDPAYSVTARDRIVIPAKEVIHVRLPLRINQTRPVTWLAPTVWHLKRLLAYFENELVASAQGAAKRGYYYSAGDNPGSIDPLEGDDTDDAGNPTADGGGFRETYEPGTNDRLPVGWKYELIDPTHPTTAFPDFTKAVLRGISSGLGVSYSTLANDLEGVSYSSIRSGTLSERDMWKCLQAWWTFAFLRPVYTEWLNAALLSGALVLPSRNPLRYSAAAFVPRGYDWVDPQNELAARENEVALGLNSRSRICRERGLDYREIAEELAEEEAIAKDLNISIQGNQVKKPVPEPAPPAEPPKAKGGRLAQLLGVKTTNGNGAH